MKKTKLVYLFPAAALLLSGCTLQEGWESTKTWVSDHIISPISSLFGGKNKEEKSSGTSNSSGQTSDDTNGSGNSDTTPKEKTYTLVKSNSALKNGDRVVVTLLQSGSSVEGLTGWNNTKDATVSQNKSEWKEYTVGSASSNGWTLYDSAASQYIAAPGGNEFKYGTSGGICSVSSEGKLVCSSRVLFKNSTYYRFYESTKEYVPFYVYSVTGGSDQGGGDQGGGGEQQGVVFPQAEVNAYIESLGVTDKLPAFTGTALSYTLYDDYGILDVEVGEGNVDAAISTYGSDLLNAKFTEGGVDDYGDMHYISEHEELDVCPWDGQYSGTPAPGHMYIEIALVPTVEEFDSFPLEKVNTFLSENDFNLQFTQEIGTAISGYASQFETLEGVGDYGNYMLISFEGDYVDSLSALLGEHLTSSGYSINTDDEIDYPYYVNDDYMSVSFWAEDGVTTIQLY